ncbi:MAG: HAD-IIIA family hydrolase [Atopobiaceae bacterium]|nr:HAD-IIIA family hydrolase [Atopobiaceae bacterium]
MRYKAVVFDLDGTLLDTLEDLHLATNHALAANGFPARTKEEVRSFVGNGYRRLARLASPEGTPDAAQEQVLRDFNTYYLAHDQDHTGPYEGIPELLEHLRAAGMPLAVVSNKGDAAVQDLMAHYFPGSFEAVAGEREGVRRKPAPDTVLAVMEQLHVAAGDIVYVGDSEVDVATAQNVGCDCIVVTWGFRSVDELVRAGATVMADTTNELERLLLA